MVKLPYYIKYLSTMFSAKEINTLLREIVDQHGGRTLFSNKYYGALNENGFELYKDSVWFNVTLIKIIGEYQEGSDGTKIKLKFTLTEYVWVVYMLIMILLSLLFVLSFIYADELWLKFMPLVMILVNHFVVMIPFNLVSKGVETKFETLVDGFFIKR